MSSEAERSDNETTNEGEEPPISDIDTPTLLTASSAVSDNGSDNVKPVDHKRKLSISPSNKRKTPCKLPKTVYRQARSNNTEVAYQNNNTYNSSETRVNVDGATVVDTHARHKAGSGTSQSALASRILREGVTSGTYVIREKRFENWKEKISNLDPDARFDRANPRKVLHSRCSAWVLVKEPGNTTRFKQHIKTCRVKPIPAGGTLMGMGWLTVKKDVEMSSNGRVGEMESGEGKAKMPCRHLSNVDNLFIDRYLKRTGAGGGGGRSIHVISKERFKKEFRYLARAQKEEVQETQKAEWAWKNDHLNLRVYATDCERFTSNDSLALSLCAKCKLLLTLNAFTNATHKKTPLDKNLKYTNREYLNPVLGRLYAKINGLRAIIEHPVSNEGIFLQP